MSGQIQGPERIESAADLGRLMDVATQATDEFRNDRARPYDGQSHTDLGERGKALVKGLTMRDVADCVVMAFIGEGCVEGGSEKVRDGTWCRNDVYRVSNDFDPLAVVNGTLCNVERMMGIYPNVPDAVRVEVKASLGLAGEENVGGENDE